MEDRVLLDDNFRSLSISNLASDRLFTIQITKSHDVISFELDQDELDDIIKGLTQLKEDVS